MGDADLVNLWAGIITPGPGHASAELVRVLAAELRSRAWPH